MMDIAPPPQKVYSPLLIAAALAAAGTCLAGSILLVRSMWNRPPENLSAPAVSPNPSPTTTYTVAERLAQYGPAARQRLWPFFQQAGVAYPPQRLVLLGLKHERQLQVYAAPPGGTLRFIRTYPVLGASGVLGPKLREGDRQVPEGIYSIPLLNPNSVHRVSLRIGYPNAFDQAMGRQDGREKLGGDIMIHGGSSSAGCLAIGDEPAEDLFVLAADTGLPNIRVILTPTDFRLRHLPPVCPPMPPWIDQLYQQIEPEVRSLPLPPD